MPPPSTTPPPAPPPVARPPSEPHAAARPDVPRAGSSLALALRMVPAARRPALTLWLHWWHEVSRIPLTVQDPGVAETKLGWWRQEVSEVAQGRARHPLMREWLALPGDCTGEVPWACWQQQLDGLTQLAQQTRWMDDASLQRHALQTTGNACAVAAHLLGARSGAATEAARHLGAGLRQAHMLARLGQDARAGWVMVGIDWLQTHGVRAHQISRPESPMPEGWAGLRSALHQRAQSTLTQALAAIKALPAQERRALKPLVYLAHTALALADAVEASGDTVLHQRILLTPLRKSWMSLLLRWGLLR